MRRARERPGSWVGWRPGPQPRRCAPMRRVETIIIALALVFYVWFLHKLGLSKVWSYILLVGWGLALTIALETVSRVFNTLGWRVTIADYPRDLSFLRMFAARIAGEAVDYTTPSAQLGGQFLMALMVRRKLEMAVGLATVVVAALAEGVGQIAFISGALLWSIQLASTVEKLLWPVIGGMAIAIGLLIAFFILQKRHPFSYLWKAAAKLNLPALATPEVRTAAARADAILLDFYARHRVRLALSCICYLIAWAMGPVEIYLLLRFLKQPATLHVVLLVEALGLLIERATFLIPAKLVSQEGGKALILGMLGYSPGIGFVIGFLRRVKEMVWVLFGLAALAEHRLIAEPRETDQTVATDVHEAASFRMEKAREGAIL